MSKPVIAVDVDEVLTPTQPALIEHHNQLHGTKLQLSDFHTYDFWEVWGGTKEESIENFMLFTESDYFDRLPPMPGAMEVLTRLSHTYNLAIVTSRMHSLLAPTMKWLDLHYPKLFESVLLGNYGVKGLSQTKSEMCQQLGAKVLIDDSMHYAKECVDVGVQALLFGDYPWNQADELPEGVTRVKDWAEVERILLHESRPAV